MHLLIIEESRVLRSQLRILGAKEKAHFLEGLKVAVENIDEIVALIKGSNGLVMQKRS